jgi:thioesterase domain-containing protein/acyl carrier protein
MPLTATGKIDRKALAELPLESPASTDYFEPPENQLERKVAAVFESVLAINPVGRLDDFFDLGGDSLRLVQLQLELRTALGSDADLADVLKDASVAAIASSIRRKRKRGFSHHPLSPLLIALRETGTKAPLFLVHGLNGQAFVGPSFVDAVGDERPIFAIQARGLVGSDRPHCRIRAMAADYVAAMQLLASRGPYMIAGMCSGSVIAQEMACQLSAAGQRVSLLLMIDPSPPLPWRGRLRRVRDLLYLHMARWPLKTRAGQAVRRDIERRLRRRSEEGRAPSGRLDKNSRDSAVRVAIDFRLAMLWHRPRAYSGPVHVIGSRNQLEDVTWNRTRWPEFLRGEVRRWEVGVDHEDVLNPGNADFARAMCECLAGAESPVRPA